MDTNKNRIGEGVYLLYFAVMVAVRAAGFYEGQTLYNIALVIGMLLFVIKIAVSGHTIKEYAVIGSLLVLAAAVYAFTGEKGLIVCFTMMLGMKGVSVKKVFSLAAVLSGVIIFIKVFLGSFGLISEVYFPIERAGAALMLRHALGYAHPNTLQMNVLIFSMAGMYLVTSMQLAADKTGRTTKKQSLMIIGFISLLVFGGNLYVHEFSGSRTGVLACLVFLAFNFWMYAVGRVRLFEKIILYAAYPFVNFIALLLPFVLKGSLFEKVDLSLFQTRLSLARGFWSCNKISLFGVRLVRPDDWPVPYGIDMGQLYLFLQLGLVAFAVLSVMTMWFVYKAIKKAWIPELVYFAGMMVIDIWEPLMYNLSFKNYLYVFMGVILFEMLDGAEICERERTVVHFVDMKALRDLLVATAMGLIIGLAVTGLFFLRTSEPTALYGSRQQDVYSQDYIEETLYLSEDDIAAIRADGSIVLDYDGAEAPEFRYGSDVAVDEYNRKAMNIGVWAGLAAAMLCLLILRRFLRAAVRG